MVGRALRARCSSAAGCDRGPWGAGAASQTGARCSGGGGRTGRLAWGRGRRSQDRRAEEGKSARGAEREALGWRGGGGAGADFAESGADEVRMRGRKYTGHRSLLYMASTSISGEGDTYDVDDAERNVEQA